MTAVITHSKVSTKPVGNDSSRIYSDSWNAVHVITGTMDANQLNANVVQAVTNDTNITGSISAQNLTFGWTGTLAAARLNSNVVQAITNDTNIHGSISAQNLTFSWSGLLGLARGGTNADLSATGGAANYLKQVSSGAAITVGTIPASDIASGAALTKTDDTNVTLTLGGTPASALLKASSLTLGWTGTLSIARGGTGAGTQQAAFDALAPTATRAGDITYWNGTHYVNLAGNNAGTKVLQQDASGVPTWVAAGAGTVTSVTIDGLAITNTGTAPPRFGYANATIAASAGSSALTIALKDNAGSDPSATSPATFWFRNVTGTTGSWTSVSATAAMSLVISSGSTMGVTSSTAFRIWVVMFNDAGTLRLGAINCSTSTQIFPLVEGVPASSTAEGGAGAADSAGVFYTGTAVSSKSFVILGYIEWNSTGLTAGTWTTANLNFIQSFGPGIRKPGEVVQTVYNSTVTQNTVSSTTFGTALSQSITPSSAANLVKAQCSGSCGQSTLLNFGVVALFRASTNLAGITQANASGGSEFCGTAIVVLDAPNTTSSTSYSVQNRGDGTHNCIWPGVQVSGDRGTLILEELMG